MNATKAFYNAIQLAQQPATIGFAAILGLGITAAITSAISALIALLVPVVATATKAAIFGYLPFLAGLIAINFKQQSQTKDLQTIAFLPPCKSYRKHINQEEITNEVLITPPPIETLFNLHMAPKQPTWEQQILKKIQLELPETQPEPEIQKTAQPIKQPAQRNIKLLNNRLTAQAICWQAIAQTAKLLDAIKASEMKEIAASLDIPKYRKMNKSQLLIEIIHAQECAPEFSQ